MFVATHFKIVAIACMTNSESVYMNPTVFHTTATGSVCVISAPSLCQTHNHDDTAEISGSFIHTAPAQQCNSVLCNFHAVSHTSARLAVQFSLV